MALLDPSRRTSSRGAKGLSPADRAARASALHHATIGLVTSVALALFITVSVKLMVGRPRPDFLARCFYPGEIPEPMTWVKPGLPGPCTNPDPSVVREGRKSFPSGHSSLAFSGWVYLALFLYDFLGAFLPPVGNEGGQVWTLFVATMPTLGAVLVGCSRVSDYWHHPTDVMAGAALGTLCAFLSYAQHRAACHLPWPGTTRPPPPSARVPREKERKKGKEGRATSDDGVCVRSEGANGRFGCSQPGFQVKVAYNTKHKRCFRRKAKGLCLLPSLSSRSPSLCRSHASALDWMRAHHPSR